MVRALCITGSMNAGGAQTFMMKIFRKLDKEKYSLDFCVSIDEEGFYDKEILSNGGRIHHVTAKTKNSRQYKKELTELLLHNKYDSVIRMGDTCFSFFDLYIAKKCKVPKVVFRSCNSNFLGSKMQLFLHKLLRDWLSKGIDVKIAPSTEAARFTFGDKAVNQGKVNILHNGLDLNAFKFDEDGRKKVRQEFQIVNSYVIGHIGRFNNQKNHLFLLEIFKEIAHRNENAVLLLVGTGELKTKVMQRVEELELSKKVIFADIRKDIGNILSAMDVFVFPSLFEGMPNTVIEAQANGLHCVVSASITQEANVTGGVEYVTLEDSAIKWADIIMAQNVERLQVKDMFIEKHYDIDSVVKEFIKYVY